MLDQELFSVDRRQKRELKRLEEEIPQWQVIVDEMIGSGEIFGLFHFHPTCSFIFV